MRLLGLLTFLSGLAALSWQVVWQLLSGLALGVSAWGASLTLAVTMAGLCLGAQLAGRWLEKKASARPLRIYAFLELIVAGAGLGLVPAFDWIAGLDAAVFRSLPHLAPLVHLAAIAALPGLATVAMGATLPVFGLMARQARLPLSTLYGLNTLGAALGALICAFALIPLFGVAQSIIVVCGVNVGVALVALALDQRLGPLADQSSQPSPSPQAVAVPQESTTAVVLIAAVTGFATLVLEVAWFRSLTAAFGSTSDAFAIMLAAVLLALGLAARLAPFFRKLSLTLAQVLACACLAVLLATPFIERFDLFTSLLDGQYPWLTVLVFLGLSLFFMGVPMLMLGATLPMLLDAQSSPRSQSFIYTVNTLAAVVGALMAGWVLLPALGFVRSAWLAALCVGAVALVLLPARPRFRFAALVSVVLGLAVGLESGAGTTRAQLNIYSSRLAEGKVLQSYNGPDVTTAAVEYASGIRALIIDGTLATAQPGPQDKLLPAHYMPWMGHLPMLMHENPRQALVICFGTGQTANAVRHENPQQLDIVDINPHVFDLAPYFSANEGVLSDPRVHPVVMDGRAWLRRTAQTYDVITLEPMPPTYAGVNALYSQEFYQLARARLSGHGMIAQWLPFHLLSPYHAASIARTFQSVFPNAILWVDPASKTGILLGSPYESVVLAGVMPGYSRAGIDRDLSETAVRTAVLMRPDKLRQFGAYGEVISDDNQLLSYGSAVHPSLRVGQSDSYDFAQWVARQSATSPEIPH